MLTSMPWLPNPPNVIDVHLQLAEVFAEEDDPISPVGVKFPDLLESACTRPSTGMGEHEKYSTIPEKMAALLHSLIKNHPFHNGNKRTALVTVLGALSRNGFHLKSSVTDDLVYDLAVNVSGDTFPSTDHGLNDDAVVQQLAAWFRQHGEHRTQTLSVMTTKEFIRRCEQAGATSRPVKGGSIGVMFGQRSVKISKATRKLDGPAIIRYLQVLQISEAATGISPAEFKQGASPERAQIYRYMSALRRLART